MSSSSGFSEGKINQQLSDMSETAIAESLPIANAISRRCREAAEVVPHAVRRIAMTRKALLRLSALLALFLFLAGWVRVQDIGNRIQGSDEASPPTVFGGICF